MKASTHAFLSHAQMRWRKAYCIPNKCHHPSRFTWICIELWLASRRGTTELATVRLGRGGPRFQALADALGAPEATPEDLAPVVDDLYRQRIRRLAGKAIRLRLWGTGQ